MFLKQYNYKPRSNSGSAGSDAAANTNTGGSPTDVATPAAPKTGTAGRRRSSATEKFAGLQGHKRNSGDASAAAQKAAYHDQNPNQPGVLGSMWQSFTKGT